MSHTEAAAPQLGYSPRHGAPDRTRVARRRASRRARLASRASATSATPSSASSPSRASGFASATSAPRTSRPRRRAASPFGSSATKTWGFACTPGLDESLDRPRRRAGARDRARVGLARYAARRLPAARRREGLVRERRRDRSVHGPHRAEARRSSTRPCARSSAKGQTAPERRGVDGLDAQHKRLVTTEGTDVRQTLTFGACGMQVIAVGDDGVAQRRSYPTWQGGDGFQGGLRARRRSSTSWRNVDRIADEAVALLSADPCPAGTRDVILESSQVGLQIHESCGHPTELDRAMGTEISLAGGSFLQPDLLGKLRYGSHLVDLVADSTSAGGMGTFGWDDEGIAAGKRHLVREGLFVDYLSSRETAAALGRASTGTMRAEGWNRTPLIRMVNVSLEPREGIARRARERHRRTASSSRPTGAGASTTCGSTSSSRARSPGRSSAASGRASCATLSTPASRRSSGARATPCAARKSGGSGASTTCGKGDPMQTDAGRPRGGARALPRRDRRDPGGRRERRDDLLALREGRAARGGRGGGGDLPHVEAARLRALRGGRARAAHGARGAGGVRARRARDARGGGVDDAARSREPRRGHPRGGGARRASSPRRKGSRGSPTARSRSRPRRASRARTARAERRGARRAARAGDGRGASRRARERRGARDVDARARRRDDARVRALARRDDRELQGLGARDAGRRRGRGLRRAHAPRRERARDRRGDGARDPRSRSSRATRSRSTRGRTTSSSSPPR